MDKHQNVPINHSLASQNVLDDSVKLAAELSFGRCRSINQVLARE